MQDTKNQEKNQELENKGWRIRSVSEFLELSMEDIILIEIKLALSKYLKERRQSCMTQAELASRLQSSQLRVDKAENGDVSVSVELLIRAVLATGATPQDVGAVIASLVP